MANLFVNMRTRDKRFTHSTWILVYMIISRVEVGPVQYTKGLVINYGEGGLQNGKIACPKLRPPPSRQGKNLLRPPLSGNFSRPPYNMAKTLSYRVKTTPKLFVPPLQHG